MSAAAAIAEPKLALTPFQESVLATPEDYDLLLGGGRGGGKSFTLGLLYLRHGEQHGNRARMLYARQTFPGVTDFEATTRELFGLVYGRAASYNAAAHLWRFPNGATLQLDQIEGPVDFGKYQGKSFTMIGVDEAGQYADPAILDLLRSCLRAPSPIQPRFVLAANPGGAGHGWIARRHVFAAAPWVPYVETKSDRRFINCPSTFIDNTFIDRVGYQGQLRAATATDPELGRAWEEGDWTVARGAFFSAVLDEARVMVEAWDPDSLPRKQTGPADNSTGAWLQRMIALQHHTAHAPGAAWELYLAHDFGVSAPSVTYVVGKSPGTTGPDGRYFPRGSLVLFDELATHEPGSLEKGMG